MKKETVILILAFIGIGFVAWLMIKYLRETNKAIEASKAPV